VPAPARGLDRARQRDLVDRSVEQLAGVPFTPLRTPPMKSSRIRLRWRITVRSSLNASTSRPSSVAYATSSPGCRLGWCWNSASCMSQNRPWSLAASDASAAISASGWISVSGKWR
jgi:hypothetical protein